MTAPAPPAERMSEEEFEALARVVILNQARPGSPRRDLVAEARRARESEREWEHKTACAWEKRDELDAEIAALTKALYESYTWTGADAGDEDDFRALVNKCEAVPREVRRMRREHDKAEAERDELRKQLDPDVIAAAKMIAANADKHPNGCCHKCRAGLADRDRLREALEEIVAHDDAKGSDHVETARAALAAGERAK